MQAAYAAVQDCASGPMCVCKPIATLPRSSAKRKQPHMEDDDHAYQEESASRYTVAMSKLGFALAELE